VGGAVKITGARRSGRGPETDCVS